MKIPLYFILPTREEKGGRKIRHRGILQRGRSALPRPLGRSTDCTHYEDANSQRLREGKEEIVEVGGGR